MTVFTYLGLGIALLSTAGQTFLGTIRDSGRWIGGSVVRSAHEFLIPDSGTTTAPANYLVDESTPYQTFPISLGTEHCYGHTGALLCEIAIKLTGSGGHPNHNAGSWVCTTYSCAILTSLVMVEANPVGDNLWVGWTSTPGSASGGQLIARKTTASGGLIVGSGSYATAGTGGETGEKLVPPGQTVKAVWSTGNGTEDYSNVKALWVTTYRKFYTP